MPETTPATRQCDECGEHVEGWAERGDNNYCRDCIYTFDETHVSCDDCHDFVAKIDADSRGRMTLCVDCVTLYDDSHTTCEHCEDVIDSDDGVAVGDNTWCGDCADNYTWRCHNCEETFSDNATSYAVAGDNSVCRSCRNDYYSRCDHCAIVVSNDDISDDGMCEECAGELGVVREYGFTPELVFYGKGIHYGVELEINASFDTAEEVDELFQLEGKSRVYLTKDSSITSGGYEITTHPHTLSEHRKMWRRFFENTPSGLTSFKTGECGVHVHIERKFLTELQIQKMNVFLNSEENHAFITAIAQRTPTTYCKRVPKTLKDKNNERRSALNTVGDDTVEVRIFRGTLRADRFWKNLEFVDAMVSWARDVSYSDLGYGSFVSFVRRWRQEYKYLFAYLVETKYTTTPVKDLIKETLQQCALLSPPQTECC